MREAFLNVFEADAETVVRRLCGHITEAQLSTIAAADYGMGQPEHLAKLQAIRLARKALPLDGWYPSEVLELIGHSEPDDPSWHPGNTGIDGWMIKAFSTAVLATCAVKSKGSYGDLPYHLGGLARSVLRLIDLGACDLRPELTQFAAWAMSQTLPQEEEPFVGLALLTGALSQRPMINDDVICAICEWISAAEVRLAQNPHGTGGVRWLVGNSWSFKADETWSPVGVHLAELKLNERSEVARNWVWTIGGALSG
jgi:hypothetical protein